MVSCACAGMMKYERLRVVMLCGLFLFDCRTRELLQRERQRLGFSCQHFGIYAILAVGTAAHRLVFFK